MGRILTGVNTDLSLWRQIENAKRMFDAEIGALLEPLDLNIELMKVAYVLDACDGGTVSELQAASDLSPEAVAAGVRTLQLRGLVTRPKPKDDPETTAVRFTTQGRLTVRRAHIAIERFQERAGGWLGSHREPLLVALRRLALLPQLPPG